LKNRVKPNPKGSGRKSGEGEFRVRVEPTNNRSERALRPAVIAREVSQCSKTHRGAHARAVITSILQTAAKHGMDLLETLRQGLTGENPFAAIPARESVPL
jgi:hypothetical protein